MPLILPASGSKVAAAYSIDNSVRFNDDDSPRLYKTSEADGNQRTWTFSCWFKLGSRTSYGTATNVEDHLISNNVGGGAFFIRIKEEGYNSTLDIGYSDGVSYLLALVTDMEFRDHSAWYHVLVCTDTTQGTDTNRCKVFVNGIRITDFSTETYPDQNTDISINDGETLYVGAQVTYHFTDGYLAEIILIDGTQYTNTDFGEFDSDSPTIWKPIDPSELTFGTNGFWLDFEDSSNLGNDANGGTDFTEDNLAAADQSTDTPTNNFCVMNILNNYHQVGVFSEGNCKIVTHGAKNSLLTGTFGLTAGKWYWEVKCTYTGGVSIGINANAVGGGYIWNGYYGDSYGFQSVDGNICHDDYDDDGCASYGSSWASGVIIGHYLDLDNNKLYFAVNDTLQNSGTGKAITAAANVHMQAYFPSFSDMETGGQSETFECNFGGCPAFAISSGNTDANSYGNFEYSPNRGGASDFDSSAKDFLAICTKNLGSDGG